MTCSRTSRARLPRSQSLDCLIHTSLPHPHSRRQNDPPTNSWLPHRPPLLPPLSTAPLSHGQTASKSRRCLYPSTVLLSRPRPRRHHNVDETRQSIPTVQPHHPRTHQPLRAPPLPNRNRTALHQPQLARLLSLDLTRLSLQYESTRLSSIQT